MTTDTPLFASQVVVRIALVLRPAILEPIAGQVVRLDPLAQLGEEPPLGGEEAVDDHGFVLEPVNAEDERRAQLPAAWAGGPCDKMNSRTIKTTCMATDSLVKDLPRCEWEWIERDGICLKTATTRFTTTMSTMLEFGRVRRESTTVDACGDHRAQIRFILSMLHDVAPTEDPL